MLMPRVSSDETVDLFDTQQMIQRMHTNIQKTQIREQVRPAPARLIKSPILGEYLDHKFSKINHTSAKLRVAFMR